MLESQDHYEIVDASGALDLTFAEGKCGTGGANVKSAPLVVMAGIHPIVMPGLVPGIHVLSQG
jgi:hypothetical protein